MASIKKRLLLNLIGETALQEDGLNKLIIEVAVGSLPNGFDIRMKRQFQGWMFVEIERPLEVPISVMQGSGRDSFNLSGERLASEFVLEVGSDYSPAVIEEAAMVPVMVEDKRAAIGISLGVPRYE